MLSIADAISSRRSVRGFLPGEVPPDTLQAIFALDPAAHAPDFPYDGVYRERQHDAAAQLHSAMGIAREDKTARRVARGALDQTVSFHR